MKRVLIFSLAYAPHMSGAELAVKEITDRMSDVEFHMVTMRFNRTDAKEERVGNVIVHRVGRGSGYLSKIFFIPHAAIAAARLDVLFKFDALWSLMSYMVLPVVLLRMGGMRTPYILTLQDGDPFEHVFHRTHIRPFLPLLRRGFREAAVVQVISTYLSSWAKDMGCAGVIEMVPNGVDVRAFAGTRIPHDGVVLITTSRLVHKNAVDVVIRGLPLLPAECRFVVIGSGEEESSLRALADSLGVSSRVSFVGFVPHAELPAHLHAADIFVRPSRTEGMGSSFIEAFAAELPVIATQAGGIADFLFDAGRNPEKAPTGFAVDVDSPEQVAQQVRAILADPDSTVRIVANAKALAASQYDWNHIVLEMQRSVFGAVLK